jgi:RNA polymerase sigma-70 factor (ECF subfamily)
LEDIIISITDNELIERVLAGNRDDYAELVRRHHPRVLGLCRSLLGDEALAEDAAQETFLKGYQRLKDFRGDAAFSTWLYRVAVNLCRDERRRRARRRSESLDAWTDDERERLRELPSGPDEDARREDADLAAKALAGLPEDYRRILILREVEGLEYKELMETLDCSMDSVKAKLRRARESLREALGHILKDPDV